MEAHRITEWMTFVQSSCSSDPHAVYLRCQNCGFTKPEIKCVECKDVVLCKNCDNTIHTIPLFQNHERTTFSPTCSSLDPCDFNWCKNCRKRMLDDWRNARHINENMMTLYNVDGKIQKEIDELELQKQNAIRSSSYYISNVQAMFNQLKETLDLKKEKMIQDFRNDRNKLFDRITSTLKVYYKKQNVIETLITVGEAIANTYNLSLVFDKQHIDIDPISEAAALFHDLPPSERIVTSQDDDQIKKSIEHVSHIVDGIKSFSCFITGNIEDQAKAILDGSIVTLDDIKKLNPHKLDVKQSPINLIRIVGNKVVVCSKNTVQVFNMNNDMKQINTLQYGCNILSIAVVDANTILTGDDGGNIVEWNLGKQTSTYSIHICGERKSVISLATCGDRFAFGCEDGTFGVFAKPKSQDWFQDVELSCKKSVRCIGVYKNNFIFADDGYINFYNVETKKVVPKIKIAPNNVYSMAVNEEDELLACSMNETFDGQLYSLQSCEMVKKLCGTQSSMNYVGFLGKSWVVTTHSDRKIRFWNCWTGEHVHTVHHHSSYICLITTEQNMLVSCDPYNAFIWI